jgi:hypothetical protein
MERLAANVDALRDRLPGAFLGMVPFDPGGNHCASSCLDLERLAELTRTDS